MNKLLSSLALAMFALPAVAHECAPGETHVSWTNATERVDGSPFPAAELANTWVLYDTSPDNLEAAANHAVAEGDATELCIDTGPGHWYFAARHIDTAGLMSDLSNAVEKVVPGVPLPPTDLRTSGTQTVYTLVQSRDRIALVAVGTVPDGTQCLVDQGANGRYVVPRDAVTWFGSTRPEVVVAACSN